MLMFLYFVEMKKKVLQVAALLVCSYAAQAQVQWPAITQTAKPWTRWWWEGSAVDSAGLTAAMEQYAKAGLGGLEITPIYGVKGTEAKFRPFLTPSWMTMLEYTLSEATRLKLGIDMATGTGWPFGGPWVTNEDASKYIAYKKIELKKGTTLTDKLEFIQEPILRSANPKPLPPDTKVLEPVSANKNLQELAIDQVRFKKPLPLVSVLAYDSKGNMTDVTRYATADGSLNWKAPEDVTLYALFMGWHGKMVERAAPGGEGLAIDHFSLPALQHYLARFDEAFKGRNTATLRSYFNDSYEVDDARGQANWTPEFFKEFQRLRGYDLRTVIPLLLAKDNSEAHLRVLYDYRMTISDLLLEKFTQPWHNWAKAQGKLIRNQSHGSPSNIFDLYEMVDIPETEGTEILRFKFASSAAHVSGKPFASAEAATWLGEHFKSTLGDVKQAVDKYFLGGVNHIFYHGTNYSPQNEPYPGWLFYAAVHFTPANSFWKDFPALNEYVARCQSFLQAGRSDNDVLLYFPFHDRNMQPGRDMLHHFDGMEGFSGTYFEAVAEEMLKEGWTFDMVSDRQLLESKAADGKVQMPGGKYKAILLADVKYLPLETLQKLNDLAKAGVKILFYENLPADVTGYHNLEQNRAAFHKTLAEISANHNSALNNHLSELMRAAGIEKEEMNGLSFERRRWEKGRTYFIANTTGKEISTYITLSEPFASVVQYSPMTQEAGAAHTMGRKVYMHLKAGESCILQTSSEKTTAPAYPYMVAAGQPQEITGDWQLQFLQGGPEIPQGTFTTKTGSWTDLQVAHASEFSGTAAYTIRIKKPKQKADAYALDLGKVGESAEVFLNGKRLATLLGPDYSVMIPAGALREDNELRILVTNGMANRMIALEKKGVQWKKFYNINMPARLAENRGADGLFTTKGWQPFPSGLLGKVTLTPQRKLVDFKTDKSQQ